MSVKTNNLQIHDSMARSKRPFEPLVPGHVGIYVCGPTVYGDAHLGHAKSYVSFDVLVRYLRHLGYRVRYVQNITDVGHLTDDADEGEDKLVRQARLDRVHPMEIAERYTRSYLKDMEALKVRHADIYPRATQHIPEQIAIIRRLVESGHAYEAGGNVYFSVASWPDYGSLSGRQLDEARSGTRVAVRSEKRDPRDFALWKAAERGHVMRWESPWGQGYPGWHIECTAMSVKYLGEQFDIHGGGIENQFPHHECEIAQAGAAGFRFARYWVHNNMINVDGRKMSKSLGNFYTVRQALEEHEAETIRYFILGTHYRSPANYTAEALAASRSGVDRLRTCMETLRRARKDAPEGERPGDRRLEEHLQEADRAFHEAMDDDLNTPGAAAALFEAVRRINGELAGPGDLSVSVLDQALALLQHLGEGVLGIAGPRAAGAGDAEPFIDHLVHVRGELKARGLYDLADRIRELLAGHGVTVKDSREGSTWTR